MQDDPRRARLFALMERYNQIGLRLPQDEDVLDDAGARTDAKVLLAEMDKVKAELDALLGGALSADKPAAVR